jgi:hypothetical protein
MPALLQLRYPFTSGFIVRMSRRKKKLYCVLYHHVGKPCNYGRCIDWNMYLINLLLYFKFNTLHGFYAILARHITSKCMAGVNISYCYCIPFAISIKLNRLILCHIGLYAINCNTRAVIQYILINGKTKLIKFLHSYKNDHKSEINYYYYYYYYYYYIRGVKKG